MCCMEEGTVLRNLISYWQELSSPWFGGALFGHGGLVALGLVAWPAALSYSLQFWLSVRGRKKGKKLSLLVSGAIFLICWITWYLPIGADMRAKLIVIPSIAFFWMVGCVFYELPAFLWSRRK